MTLTKPVVGQFVRITRLWGEVLPAPAWGAVIKQFHAEGDVFDFDIEIFVGRELVELHLGKGVGGNPIPLDEQDVFTVRTINTLPQYALTAWVKHQLLKGENT